MDYKKSILKKLIDMKCDSDEFEDMLIDVESIKAFLELLPDETVEQIDEDLEAYVQ